MPPGGSSGERWYPPPTRPPAWLEDRDSSPPLEPRQIAGIYRSLRQAREDSKDESGAGDLYYGEMEMRRRATPRLGAKRARAHRGGELFIIRVYWAVAGYGLRASRALGALVLMILVGGAALHWFGFHHHRNYGRSVLFAVESSVSLLRPPDTTLTAGGQIVQIVLRLGGPLLVGLALLAVRTRVKR